MADKIANTSEVSYGVSWQMFALQRKKIASVS